ncbi:MAG: hypothetical protein WB998_07825, partial [Solirubrobacteraceae bacterium]
MERFKPFSLMRSASHPSVPSLSEPAAVGSPSPSGLLSSSRRIAARRSSASFGVRCSGVGRGPLP